MQPDSLAVAQNTLTEGAPIEKTLSIWELVTSGGIGGQSIMIILTLLLFLAFYLYFERIFAINAAAKIDSNFMNNIKLNITNGNLDAAKMLCAQTKSPVARLVEKGISRIGRPLEDINSAIENAGKLEVYKLEKNVGILATIAGVGPMIGFLGTVIGMIISFHAMASGGGQIEVKDLSGGIQTAMTTTVAGLIVGIIAYMGYNHVVVKTDKVINLMEVNATDFLDLLNEPS
ncbi:MAG TPA: MotA/TolQ/ExbB proton channel family protein [Flavobacterium sp.]|nr:MotA/TolQ/ExbB proton channel family protein [Flavobacterium sp.]